MPQYESHSESETHRLGERLGGCLCAGDVVLLMGELGTGKSVMARGIARGMGVTGAIPSPTFTLMTVHRGAKCPLYHMDLYRLEDASELWESGLEEHIGGDGVALIEWPERAMEAMPSRHLVIRLTSSDDNPAQTRRIWIAPNGGFPDVPWQEALRVAGKEGTP